MEYALGKVFSGENYIMQDVWCLTRAGREHILLLTSAILKIESHEWAVAGKSWKLQRTSEGKRQAEKCSRFSEVDNWFHWFILLAAQTNCWEENTFLISPTVYNNQKSFSWSKKNRKETKIRTHPLAFNFYSIFCQNILKFQIQERRLVWKVR